MVEYRRISLKKELCDAVERFINEHPELGYRSIAGFVEDSMRRRGEQMGFLKEADLSPRFEHFNVYEDHVTIWDRKERRLIDVYFRNGKPYCEFCEEFDCEHIHFALSLPKVIEPLRRAGWVIEEGKIIRPPS